MPQIDARRGRAVAQASTAAALDLATPPVCRAVKTPVGLAAGVLASTTANRATGFAGGTRLTESAWQIVVVRAMNR
ncbi:hypothetical protein HYW61_00150 [candidate division WWE3 bacterium]|nr:hypothetical protein [candidate division WWE3 bacterium]